jgi:hypothetical protein
VRRALLVPALLAAGCSNGGGMTMMPSSDYEAKELKLTAKVASNGSSILATALLQDPEGSWVTLDEDRLLLGDGTKTAELIAYDQGYVALLESASTTPALLLERGEGADARVEVPLPEAFALAAPPDPSPLGAPITFTWDEYPGEPSITVTSPCFADVRRSLTAYTGTFTLHPTDLAFTSDNGVCDVYVEVARTALLGLAASEPLGSVTGSSQQIRTVHFTGTR